MLPDAVRDPVRDLTRLVLPVACPGCGALDVPWCASCLAPLRAALRRRERAAPRLDRLDGVPPLPVWAPADYAGPVRAVVVAWKDRGRADLDGPLGRVARGAGATLRDVLLGRGPTSGGASSQLLVVPAPTAPSARRARGRDPVAGLARAVAAGLSAGTPGRTSSARPAALLAHRGRARDQVGLGARARGARLAAVRLASGPGVRRALLEPLPCLLVDDVLTTGATLAACEAALTAAGMPVLGAFVLAATPAPAGARTTGLP